MASMLEDQADPGSLAAGPCGSSLALLRQRWQSLLVRGVGVTDTNAVVGFARLELQRLSGLVQPLYILDMERRLAYELHRRQPLLYLRITHAWPLDETIDAHHMGASSSSPKGQSVRLHHYTLENIADRARCRNRLPLVLLGTVLGIEELPTVGLFVDELLALLACRGSWTDVSVPVRGNSGKTMFV